LVTHRHARLNAINMHVAEQGEGPLILLPHGLPETWYSWRRRIDALSAIGHRVVAGPARLRRHRRPHAMDQYSIFHLNGHANAKRGRRPSRSGKACGICRKARAQGQTGPVAKAAIKEGE
jgi:hypothetical protein